MARRNTYNTPEAIEAVETFPTHLYHVDGIDAETGKKRTVIVEVPTMFPEAGTATKDLREEGKLARNFAFDPFGSKGLAREAARYNEDGSLRLSRITGTLHIRSAKKVDTVVPRSDVAWYAEAVASRREARQS